MDGLSPELVEWLAAGPPWVQHRLQRGTLAEPGGVEGTQTVRQAMLSHPLVQGLVGDLAQWPLPMLNSHKSARHPMHRLAFLADIGLRAEDPGMGAVVERILAHQSPQGPFQLAANISPSYGGSGQDVYAWALCDAPLVVFSLVRLGLGGEAPVRQAIEHLVSLVRPNGWPCAVSPELGRWRGPGRKEDPCPYANLVMLKLLAELPEYHDSPQVHSGVETALELWTLSQERHPYMFFMGTDFRKLKAPLIWYDILHLTDVLSRFAWLRDDPRLGEMVEVVRSKADASGRFTLESIWKAWEGWDFGQKKSPSPWLTLVIWEMLERMERPTGVACNVCVS